MWYDYGHGQTGTKLSLQDQLKTSLTTGIIVPKQYSAAPNRPPTP